MKKHFLLSILFFTSLFCKAQVPNSSFENLTSDGGIKHWGAAIMIPIVLDTNGHPTDSLIKDHEFYFSTNDAHTGQRALEMRNAKWKVSSEIIPGLVFSRPNDSDYFAFNSPIPVGQTPSVFSFYYKFLPVGNDTAYAYMRISDSLDNLVGEANVYIHGTTSSYALSSSPIVYSGTGTPAFFSIGFTTCKPGAPAHFGTRFTVDDVGPAAITTGIYQDKRNTNPFSYPNPVNTELNIYLKETSATIAELYLVDSGGKELRTVSYSVSENKIIVQTGDLPKGVYFLHIVSDSQSYSTRFIK